MAGRYCELNLSLNLLISLPSLSVRAAVELEKDLLILELILSELFLGLLRFICSWASSELIF